MQDLIVMIKKYTLFFLFIFLHNLSAVQDGPIVTPNDSATEQTDEYYDALDSMVDHQPDFEDEELNISARTKNFIFAHMPVWAKKLICSLIINLDQATEYAATQWKYIKKSLPL
jgi:hypothetical protein